MSGSFRIVVIAATATLSLLPMVPPQAANAQVDIRIGPQQAQQPPRGGAWGDRDHDGIPNDRDKCPDDPEDIDGFQDADG